MYFSGNILGANLKILTYLLVFLLVLSGAFYGIVRFKPEWNPLRGFSFGGPEVVAMKTVDPADYQSLRDSIDALDLLIRAESDPTRLKGFKDRQEYFWQRLVATRAALTPPTPQPGALPVSSPQNDEQEFGGLVQILTKVLIGTAAVLGTIILVLAIMLRRRKAEVTRKLEALKSDDRFKSPRGGFQEAADPTLVRPRRRADGQDATLPGATSLPNVQPRSTPAPGPTTTAQPAIPPTSFGPIDANSEFDHTVLATQTANLRPTARQRVTNAIKGLAEALAALKTPTAAPERATRTRLRVTSQNSTRYTQGMEPTRFEGLPDPHPLEATRFDREREEKGDIVKLARRGYTSSEIARRLRIAQDQVETVIRLQRENGG